jgi:hypothetical protein
MSQPTYRACPTSGATRARASTHDKRAALIERGHDLYQTPPEATLALLSAEPLPLTIWEPACGPGAIARVLRGAGHTVFASDLVDYKSPDQNAGGWDFLLQRCVPDGVEAIVTNPPFKLANEFVAHALRLCPSVAMLLRLAFLESTRRTPILENGRLARVHVFRNRLPAMHRHGWTGNRVSNPTPFAWFVWTRNHEGPTHFHRLSWIPPNKSEEA